MSTTSLRSSTDFERVLRTGRRARRGPITVYARPLESSVEPTRLGLAVRCERAVDRNLLKRRLRGAWKAAAVPAGFEVAVRAEPRALDVSYQELEKHLSAALVQVGIG